MTTPHSFNRTTCACVDCTKCCKRQPGPLAPGDYEMIQHHLRATDNEMKSMFVASPGAIIRDESGIEHFFHRSSVRGAVFELLREGQRVEFTPEDSQKGPRAGDVRLVE